MSVFWTLFILYFQTVNILALKSVQTLNTFNENNPLLPPSNKVGWGDLKDFFKIISCIFNEVGIQEKNLITIGIKIA